MLWGRATFFPSSTLRQTRIAIHLIYQHESWADVQITNLSRRLLMELNLSIGTGEESKTQHTAVSQRTLRCVLGNRSVMTVGDLSPDVRWINEYQFANLQWKKNGLGLGLEMSLSLTWESRKMIKGYKSFDLVQNQNNSYNMNLNYITCLNGKGPC